MRMQAQLSPPLRGRIRAPGDKSISHRAFILGALAEGETEVHDVLEGADVLRTIAAVQAFGASVERLAPGQYRIAGCGARGFASPADVLDFGNAGTGVRLMMGAAGGFPVHAVYTGDESLRGRPMARVLDPLALMGVRALARDGKFLPAAVQGPETPGAIRYALPHASAQVKSALLLCGLRARGVTEIVEPVPTRDHTERMLTAFGAQLECEPRGSGRVIRLVGDAKLRARDIAVPGDPSSAAFPVAAALLVPGSDIVIEGVLASPGRFGFYETLIEMGARLEILNRCEAGGEDIVDLHVRHSTLRGITLPLSRVPAMVDEIPVLAVLAGFADGRTIIDGAAELRVKESDRLALTAAGLQRIGIAVTEHPAGLVIDGAPEGRNRHGPDPHSPANTLPTHGDHRIAMSFLVAGLAIPGVMVVDRSEMIATSFPGFPGLMNGLGAPVAEIPEEPA